MMLQRTPEWFAERLGKVTASRIHDVMAKIKTGEAVTRRNYKAEKVLERYTGVSQENNYLSNAMQAGIEKEVAAREIFEWENKIIVQECGFFDHPTIVNAGASPDGLIGNDALLELKCPEAFAMKEALLGNSLDRKYVLQAQWQMACTGRKLVYVVFYREGCPQAVAQVFRNDDPLSETGIPALEAEVKQFLAEVEYDYSALCHARPLP